jgi:mono/diheme cytochrome c family protein
VKNFVVGALAAVVTLAVGALGYFGLGFAAVGADAKPPAWEAGFMNSAVHASVRRKAPRLQNPLAPTDETLIAGGKLYLDDCVGCHGAPGEPSSAFGATFYPQVPQFPSTGTRYSEAEVFWVAKHGIRWTGMSPQGPYYTDTELWSLSAFITRITNLSPNVMRGIQQPPSK